MNSTELKDFFRSQVRDDVVPYLWSDEEIYVYMNDAQQMFVRLTGGIFDISSDATQVSVVAGEKYATLHPAILHIREAILVSEARKLKLANLADNEFFTTYDFGVIKNLSLTDIPGRIDYMVIGEARNTCRWVQVPIVDDTVQLAITRLPLVDITGDGQDFEIPSEHHIHLLNRMKSLALNKQDADAFNPKAAEEAETKFQNYCQHAWREWERYRHKPRTVAYGGY